MKIAFKYKLSLAISLIIISVLTGVFLVFQADIEEDALVRIKAQMTSTHELVSDLIEARRGRLRELATGIIRSEALHDLLSSPVLGSDVRNEIVVNEILPFYPRVSLLCVTAPDGEILGANASGRRLQAALIHDGVIKPALRGLPGEGFVFLDQECVQIVAVPIPVDSFPDGRSRGVLLTGMIWENADLERIRDLSGVQIALYDQGRAVLYTGTPFRRDDSAYDMIEKRPRPIWQIATQAPKISKADNERFLFLKAKDSRELAPAFVIARSLDTELRFVRQIRTDMVLFGLGGIFLGIGVSLFFDPIKETLARAADRAVRCAHDMLREAAMINGEFDGNALPEIQIGIGINAGPVIVGNTGSEDRRKYGIVGSAVNVTQRIQEFAGPGEIVVSAALLSQTREDLQVDRCFEKRLKGLQDPVVLYRIVPTGEGQEAATGGSSIEREGDRLCAPDGANGG